MIKGLTLDTTGPAKLSPNGLKPSAKNVGGPGTTQKQLAQTNEPHASATRSVADAAGGANNLLLRMWKGTKR